MFELTGFQRDLLYVIASLDRPSGQIVKEALEEDLDEVNHGRLYPNLDTLVNRSLVEKGQLDRRTNFYQITDKGLDLLRERREWENSKVEFLG
jgi:DNA-binding PadR family transcriptional regulator